MIDPTQQARRTWQSWAHYRAWRDDPKNHESTTRTLSGIVVALEGEAVRSTARVHDQARALRRRAAEGRPA